MLAGEILFGFFFIFTEQSEFKIFNCLVNINHSYHINAHYEIVFTIHSLVKRENIFINFKIYYIPYYILSSGLCSH